MHSLSELRRHDRFSSAFVDARDVVVWLPPGYDEGGRYPVLYMHDGQNLFDPETAYLKGQHWRVSETAAELIEAHRIEPLIIVGINNTGARRLHEYTPTRDPRRSRAHV